MNKLIFITLSFLFYLAFSGFVDYRFAGQYRSFSFLFFSLHFYLVGGAVYGYGDNAPKQYSPWSSKIYGVQNQPLKK